MRDQIKSQSVSDFETEISKFDLLYQTASYPEFLIFHQAQSHRSLVYQEFDGMTEYGFCLYQYDYPHKFMLHWDRVDQCGKG